MNEQQKIYKTKRTPLKIITLGHPTLRQKAAELTLTQIKSAEVQKFIQDMGKTLRIVGNGAALAANQVNKLWQIIVIELTNMSAKVLINPKIEKLAGEEELAFEGCLSIPGYWGQVWRNQRVVVEALNQQGEKIKVKASGFNARVIQHEIDHLNGIVFLDRMKDISSLITTEELNRQIEKKKQKEVSNES